MAIKNMKDLKQKKQQLEFQEKFYKKELLFSTSGILDNFAINFRNLAFDFGYRVVAKYIFSRRKKHHTELK